MSEPLKLAIVGCGTIADTHVKAIGAHPELQIAALIDAVPEMSGRLAAKLAQDADAPAPAQFRSLSEAAAGAAFDGVVICAPTGLHASLGAAALEAGKHVIVEKPIDVDLPRARGLVERARQYPRLVTSIISQHRFDPEAVAIQRAAKAGRLGTLSSAVVSIALWRSQSYYDSAAWRGTWAMDGGGALTNQGIHTLDLLLWIMGRPVEISAMTGQLTHQRIEVEDTAVAIIRFESGALATVHATTAAYPNVTNRLQVHGSTGSAVIDMDRLSYFHTVDQAGPTTAFMGHPFGEANHAAEELARLEPEAVPHLGFATGHVRQYADIVRAIRTATPPTVTAEEALICLATIRSVYLSQILRKPIELQDVLDGAYDDIDVTKGSAR